MFVLLCSSKSHFVSIWRVVLDNGGGDLWYLCVGLWMDKSKLYRLHKGNSSVKVIMEKRQIINIHVMSIFLCVQCADLYLYWKEIKE